MVFNHYLEINFNCPVLRHWSPNNIAYLNTNFIRPTAYAVCISEERHVSSCPQDTYLYDGGYQKNTITVFQSERLLHRRGTVSAADARAGKRSDHALAFHPDRNMRRKNERNNNNLLYTGCLRQWTAGNPVNRRPDHKFRWATIFQDSERCDVCFPPTHPHVCKQLFYQKYCSDRRTSDVVSGRKFYLVGHFFFDYNCSLLKKKSA